MSFLMNISGYAAVFGVSSDQTRPEYGLPAAKEVIARGAFTRALAACTFLALTIDHDRSRTLATTEKGLQLWQDPVGLAFAASLRNDAIGREAAAAIRAGRCRGASFSFTTSNVTGRRGQDSFGHYYELLDVPFLLD